MKSKRLLSTCGISAAMCLLLGIASAGITMDRGVNNHAHDASFVKNSQMAKEGKLKQGQVTKVHLVPHTHDDVGWLKTPD